MQIINSKNNHNKIPAGKDIVNNPTYAPNLGPVVAELLEKRASGIYNAAGEQKISRYEFAIEVADVFGLDKNIIQPVTYEEFSSGRVAPRPQCASLDTEKLRRTVQARLWGPRQALEAYETNGKGVNN